MKRRILYALVGAVLLAGGVAAAMALLIFMLAKFGEVGGAVWLVTMLGIAGGCVGWMHAKWG